MFDYNRISTDGLKALRDKKKRRVEVFMKLKYQSEEVRSLVHKLGEEIGHINAVIYARENTFTLPNF